MPERIDGAVADGVDVDPDRVGRPRMLADGAEPKPDRRPEEDEPRERDEDEGDPDHQVEVPEDVAEERDVVEEREVDVRDARDVGRRPFLSRRCR